MFRDGTLLRERRRPDDLGRAGLASDAADRAEVDRAMKAWPGMHQFHWISARLFHHGGRPAEAFADVQKAIDLDPGQVTYWQTFCQELLEHIDAPAPHLIEPGLVEKIRTDVSATLDSPESAEFFRKASVQRADLSPQQVLQSIRSEAERWSRLIRTVGIQVD